jgi:hypothetical protein
MPYIKAKKANVGAGSRVAPDRFEKPQLNQKNQSNAEPIELSNLKNLISAGNQNANAEPIELSNLKNLISWRIQKLPYVV